MESPDDTYENTITAINGLVQRLTAQANYWRTEPARGGLTSALRSSVRNLEKARHSVETARMIEKGTA